MALARRNVCDCEDFRMPCARFGSGRYRVRHPKTTRGGNHASIRARFLGNTSEVLGEPPKVFVLRLLQQRVVQIPDEMDQAVLSGALYAVVRRLEIRHQDTRETLEQCLNCFALACGVWNYATSCMLVRTHT
jgi:hypothetical protein